MLVAVALGWWALEHVRVSARFTEAQAESIGPANWGEIPTRSQVEVATNAAGTFLGMEDELLLERMRTGAVSAVKINHGGSSLSLRLDFENGLRAAFKPEQVHLQSQPRKEVAAYRLNRLLGMNAVPPALMRTIHRDELVAHVQPASPAAVERILNEAIFDEEGFTRGELSYWVPVLTDSHLDTLDGVLTWWRWLTVGQDIPLDKMALMEQLSSLLLFDLLTNNSDRFSGGNLLVTPDQQTLYWMDNTFGFQPDPEGHSKCRIYLSRCQKFSRTFVNALRALTRQRIRQALEPNPDVLSEEELNGVLVRRDVALRHVESLVNQWGAEKVLVFK